jgi:hypothetical protein
MQASSGGPDSEAVTVYHDTLASLASWAPEGADTPEAAAGYT